MPTKKGTTRVDAPKSRTKRKVRDGVKTEDGKVIVGKEVGVTVAVTADPPQFLRISNWGERIVPDGVESIRRARLALTDDLERETERDIKAYKKLINAVDHDDDEPKKRAKKGSAQERARRRLGDGYG